MRIGKSVWHAKRKDISNAEIPEYESPKEIVTHFNYLTVMPASSRGGLEILKHGETLYDTWTVVANSRYFDGVFNAGDLMWVDGAEPIENDIYGTTANALITSVNEVNCTISIVLERNQNQTSNENY